MVRFATVRKLALALPETEERSSYGTPGFRVRDKLFCRLLEDRESIVVYVDPVQRSELVEWKPQTFQVTAHYQNHPLLIVRLATAEREELRELLVESWRRRAPKRLVAAYDSGR
jgi:hypothetical protein